MNDEFAPRLYLIGRSDIPQMNAGKLAAQAAHAASEFEAHVATTAPDTVLRDMYSKWREDRKFGVTITLIGTDNEIRELLSTQLHRGYVHDPTYPMFNAQGDMFTWPLDTVGWCFPTNTSQLASVQESGLKLYP